MKSVQGIYRQISQFRETFFAFLSDFFRRFRWGFASGMQAGFLIVAKRDTRRDPPLLGGRFSLLLQLPLPLLGESAAPPSMAFRTTVNIIAGSGFSRGLTGRRKASFAAEVFSSRLAGRFQNHSFLECSLWPRHVWDNERRAVGICRRLLEFAPDT